ncbi:MAG: hypothetical protein P4L56_26195 [Candidatus Sulfopaludibacter sp.]|nr:hypothetical protein [Candidatus Sulfopaludibacter sp.]
MHILTYGGLMGLLSGGIVIALFNVLLTLALVRRVVRLYTPLLVASFAVYTVLLFAQPDFYVEHRHDLPAELSYLFLLLSLLAWTWWLEHRHGIAGALLLSASALSAVLFAFAKETYFVSALCLVAGLALVDGSNRWRHACFAGFLLVVECCSLAWTQHINGPFVDPTAGASSAYQMSLNPATIWNGFLFYLSHLLNPALVLLVVLAVLSLWRDRRKFILAVTFSVAGLAGFATHAMLPNHMLAEYAWVGAPLFAAPVLALGAAASAANWRWAQFGMAVLLAGLAIAGPAGYQDSYQTDDAKWIVAEDRKCSEIAASLPSLKAIPQPARVLVVGLDDSSLPWESQGFVRLEFGRRLSWIVVLPRTVQYRRNSRLVQFVDAGDVRSGDFDYVATYRPGGTLVSIRALAAIPKSVSLTEVLVPGLSPLLAATRSRPPDPVPLIRAASLAMEWGLWTEAAKWLEQAQQEGASDATYQRLVSELHSRTSDTSRSVVAKLTAQPAHIVQPDGSGLGVTELFWTVPDGAPFEIHVNAPDGPLFVDGQKSGHARTAKWVKNGMQFFLQDVAGGKPLTRENTLANVTVEVTR